MNGAVSQADLRVLFSFCAPRGGMKMYTGQRGAQATHIKKNKFTAPSNKNTILLSYSEGIKIKHFKTKKTHSQMIH